MVVADGIMDGVALVVGAVVLVGLAVGKVIPAVLCWFVDLRILMHNLSKEVANHEEHDGMEIPRR